MEVSFISKKVMTNDDLVNENIRFKEVLVIGPKGEQLGVMMRREALEKAYDYELDLLCVAPNGNPPVCKIVDYGRYRFESQKKAKEAGISMSQRLNPCAYPRLLIRTILIRSFVRPATGLKTE